MEALKELEILSGHDKSFGTATGAPSLLAKLGLFMKDEYEDNDDDGCAVFARKERFFDIKGKYRTFSIFRFFFQLKLFIPFL